MHHNVIESMNSPEWANYSYYQQDAIMEESVSVHPYPQQLEATSDATAPSVLTCEPDAVIIPEIPIVTTTNLSIPSPNDSIRQEISPAATLPFASHPSDSEATLPTIVPAASTSLTTIQALHSKASGSSPPTAAVESSIISTEATSTVTIDHGMQTRSQSETLPSAPSHLVLPNPADESISPLARTAIIHDEAAVSLSSSLQAWKSRRNSLHISATTITVITCVTNAHDNSVVVIPITITMPVPDSSADVLVGAWTWLDDG
jgi:hypothetical protein